ncbi:hemolysin-III related domain-containing protein [Ditylenchus destructor]|nr:hemolysin-III related domain-containing protein [Ditylenchus destructor]
MPSVLITKALVDSSYRDLQYSIAIIYGFFTTLLFFTSTLYHLCELLYRPNKRRLRYYLHITDRVSIYFFIAASSMPWLTLRNCDYLGLNLKWIVWAFAVFGVVYQLNFHEKHKSVETCLYVVIASVPYVAIFSMNDRSGLPSMLLGGAVYAVGCVFFKMDGVVPFAHAIWHIHVIVGASIHTYTVYSTLLGPDKYNPFPDVDFSASFADAAKVQLNQS